MSSPTELLPSTSIAATSWNGHLRVYTQDIEGGIRESRYDGSWTGGTAKDVIAKAKPYSPIAAFSYDSGKNVRVYYLTPENVIQEICWENTGKWIAGALNASNFKASPASRLAVIGHTWDGGFTRLYYQGPDEMIGELTLDKDHWTQQSTIGEKPMLGTGLAAAAYETRSETGIRCYYQLPNGTLAEAALNRGGKWFKGGFPQVDTAAPACNLAAYAYGPDSPNLQVYFLDKTNAPTQWVLHDRVWKGPNHPGQTTTSPASGAAIIPESSPDNLRFYTQDGNNRIQEWVSSGSKWSKGSLIPTGGLQQ